MDWLPDIAPDAGPTRSPSWAVDRLQFGDGYVQRGVSGINSQTDSFSVAWSMLTRDEFTELSRFLESRKGVYAFLWHAPWDDGARRWVCENLQTTQPTSARFGAIQATFVEDHNP